MYKIYLPIDNNLTGFIMGWLAVIVVHLVLLNVVCSENADFDAVSTETFSNVIIIYINNCINNL